MVLGLIVIVLIIVAKEFIFTTKPLELPEFQNSLSEINIDFELLESQELKELMLSDELKAPEEFGRTNPFQDY